MLHVLDRDRRPARIRSEQRLQPLLALDERKLAKILAFFVEQVEREIDQPRIVPVGERVLQRVEAQRVGRVERCDFAVDDAVRKSRGACRDGAELLRPVESLARVERSLAVGDPQLRCDNRRS